MTISVFLAWYVFVSYTNARTLKLSTLGVDSAVVFGLVAEAPQSNAVQDGLLPLNEISIGSTSAGSTDQLLADVPAYLKGGLKVHSEMYLAQPPFS